MWNRIACWAALCAAGATASAQVNLMSNGSFEADGELSSSTTLTGWSVTAGNIDTRPMLVGGSVATDGEFLLDLEGTVAATITQSVVGLVVGEPYVFSFDLGANTANTVLGIVLSGATNLDETLPAIAGPLTPVARSFKAGATTLTVTFIDRGGTGGNAGPALDNVRLVRAGLADCNDNGVDDDEDIAAGTSLDCFDSSAAPGTRGGPNGVPDECECVADWNRDGVVNSTDVSDFVNTFFADQVAGTINGDINCNGVSNSTDVSDFINLWFSAQAGQLPFSGCAI
jgi:hypothetical protein